MWVLQLCVYPWCSDSPLGLVLVQKSPRVTADTPRWRSPCVACLARCRCNLFISVVGLDFKNSLVNSGVPTKVVGWVKSWASFESLTGHLFFTGCLIFPFNVNILKLLYFLGQWQLCILATVYRQRNWINYCDFTSLPVCEYRKISTWL